MPRPKEELSGASSGAKLKIGFVFDDTLDSVDGVSQQVKTFGRWLSQQGHSVSYLVGQTSACQWAGGPIYSLAHNQRVVFNGNRLSIPLPASRRRIRKVLAVEKFDVLHVQMPHSPLMAGRVVKAADANCAVIGTFHILPSGLLARAGSRLLRLSYGRSLRRFDQILSVSQPAADFASKTYGLRSTILPNVVDVHKLSPRTEASTQDDQIVFLGRLVKRKGCAELLKAFQLLLPELPSARLIIAGDGPLRPKLERYVRRHRLGQSVKFEGFVSEENKAQLLSEARIACFPSLYGESFGVVLIEAVSAGAGVVVGGNNPGYTSVLGERPQLLIDPKDNMAFAAHLKHLLSDDALSKKLHKWQQSILTKYDVETVGPKLVAVYQAVIAKRLFRRHN